MEPTGVLKEGDRVEIRCLSDGNPQPHFSISKEVPRAGCLGVVGVGIWAELLSKGVCEGGTLLTH